MEQEITTFSSGPLQAAREGNSLLVDIQGAANFLGLSNWQIRGLVTSGELKVV
jgi:hypothetical protein